MDKQGFLQRMGVVVAQQKEAIFAMPSDSFEVVHCPALCGTEICEFRDVRHFAGQIDLPERDNQGLPGRPITPLQREQLTIMSSVQADQRAARFGRKVRPQGSAKHDRFVRRVPGCSASCGKGIRGRK